ncbi:ABC transporter ATP-binding protein [Bacillus mojavensis]|uniref:ABC transporter ATP-binding protein n=1 Tax=Bacillus mojavensis TaxID=72360 RepID=UPI002DB8D5A6|nr:ABC transporter ATP-binding protein [Bacillus mojavensis]MEC1615688.1 ABC transporter ATP-binding protein [Bacillus mojavensis]MEC1622600.1 ABC transporter ATP-binding protein [Bacillus mojavensis]MEC1633359.1 ABC transporter ATP-binding protein [Bacillus mojavensis]MEC1660062.1 ABC transporter ATP-binding protein [Bacillus mojavensis]MEC1683048.1 ABC transporter ATP-binding protein [Bacillus mojavensis]
MKQAKKQGILERFYYSSDEIIEKPFNWAQMWRLLSYVKPYRKTILPLSFLTVLIGTAVKLVIPILIGVYVLDQAITAKNSELLMQLMMLISVLYAVNYAANMLRIRWMNQLGQHVIYDLRQHLFTHVQRLSHRFFDQRSAGSILVRIMNDINSLQELFTSGVINLLTDLLLLAGVVIILFTLSPELTIAIMVTLPIMFFISTSLRKKIRRSWQTVRLKQSKLNSHLNESIQGIRVTQAFTQEQENMTYFDGVNQENYQSWREATRKNAVFRPLVEMTNAIGTAVLIWYGATLIMNETITIGVFVSFAFYLGMFWEPISRLGQVYNQLLMGMASSERIFEFLDEQPNVKEKPEAIHKKNIKGHISFEEVEFSYDEKRKALHSVSFSIPAGSTLALVGHTGSGKTTIANLISRFYDATGGTIKIDGIPITDLSLASLRSQISIVLQDTFIFSGTIMENIRFGRPDASDEEVIKAAQAVGADEFISGLAEGYETEVEERGSVLSAGQRQLISFARALLADPAIIILDEATASIDTETEVKIQQALKTLLKDRTAVMIAHRLSTIRDADHIIVLDHGRKMEEGNHEQLLGKGGIYAGLVKSQYSIAAE